VHGQQSTKLHSVRAVCDFIMILSVERAAVSQSIKGVGYALDGPGFESR